MPPPPPHDGVTLIHPGFGPRQVLRYHLTQGARTTSEMACDLDMKNDGQLGPMPTLVVDLDTLVEDVLADGSARLRAAIVRTSVRDRPGSSVPGDVVLSQAAAMQGVVITETLAPDGQLTGSTLDAADAVPASAREQLDRLTRSLAQIAMRLPTEPVGVGAMWRERKTLPEGGIRATAETYYTLTSLSGTAIAYTAVGLSSGAPQTIEQDGMKVEVSDTRGHFTASGTVDLARYAFDVTSTSNFATAMNVIAPEGTPGAGRSTVEIAMAIQVSPAELPATPPAPAPDPQPPATARTTAGAPAGTAPAPARRAASPVQIQQDPGPPSQTHSAP